MRQLKNKRQLNPVNEEEDENKSSSQNNDIQTNYNNSAIIPSKRTVAQIVPLMTNIQLYSNFMLYCDAPFDIRYFSNETFYDEVYQSKNIRIAGIKDFKNERIVFIGMDTLSTQVKDPSFLIKQLRSLSSQDAYAMAGQIETNYEMYKQQLRAAYNLENKGQRFTMDKEKLYQKSIEMIKKVTKNSSKVALVNVISMDFNTMEMSKTVGGGTYEFGKVLLNKKDQLLSGLTRLGQFNFGGDMKNFTKHQFPQCDEREVPVSIHTLDGFIIPCTSRLHTIPLDEQNLNILLIKQFNIDPLLLERLKDIREKMADYGIESLITENKYGDKQYIDLSHQTVEGLQFEQFSFSTDQFKIQDNPEREVCSKNQQYNQFGDIDKGYNCNNQIQQGRKNSYDDYQYKEKNNNIGYQQPSSNKCNYSSHATESEIYSSSFENNMFCGSEENLMNFEAPQFDMSSTQTVNQSYLQPDQLQLSSDIKISQNLNNPQLFKTIVEEKKQSAIKFINKFYSPLIK